MWVLPGKIRLLGALVAALLSWAGPAWAADTVETWDTGAVDVDAYVGADGIGGPRKDRTGYLDAMLGYGVVDRVSLYVGATKSFDADLRDAGAEYYWGAFATPVDGDHFDFDLFMDVWSGGDRNSEVSLTPALELNLDATADQSCAGAYLRAALPHYGLTPAPAVERGSSHALEVELGVYLTVDSGHMLFVEYDAVWQEPASRKRGPIEHGSVAFGYNVVLSDIVELINEVHIDVPKRTTEAIGGAMTGVILTLPGAT